MDISRRSAQRHHRQRKYSVCVVLCHHHPRAAGRGCQPAVARRGRLRHHRRLRRDHDGEHLPQLSVRRRAPADAASASLGRLLGTPIRHRRMATTTSSQKWTERLRIIFVSALQVDKAVFFTAAITVTAFVPLFTMQGVEGQIFGPMARTYGYALAGALLSTFTVTPVLAALLLPKEIEETETSNRACLAVELIRRCFAGRSSHLRNCRDGGRSHFSRSAGLPHPGSAVNFCRRWRRAISGSGLRCRRRCRSMRAPPPRARCAKSCCGIRRSSPWCRSTAVPITAATPRRSPTSNCLRHSSRSTNGRPTSPRKN